MQEIKKHRKPKNWRRNIGCQLCGGPAELRALKIRRKQARYDDWRDVHISMKDLSFKDVASGLIFFSAMLALIVFTIICFG